MKSLVREVRILASAINLAKQFFAHLTLMMCYYLN